MIKLEWKFNGRSVAPGQLGAEVAKAFKAEAINRARAAVAKVQCPVHGAGLKNVTVQAEGSPPALASTKRAATTYDSGSRVVYAGTVLPGRSRA